MATKTEIARRHELGQAEFKKKAETASNGKGKKPKSIFERGLGILSGAISSAVNNIRKIEGAENRRKVYRDNPTKKPPPKPAVPKAAAKPQTTAAPKAAPATEKRTSGRDNKPGRANQNPEGNYDQKRTTTAKTKSTLEAKKPDAAKQTQTDRNNKASAARRKQRRKSSNSKYNEGPGGKFNFAGAVSRQLTGR